MRDQNEVEKREENWIVWLEIVVRKGGLPSSVVGLRDLAFFCCLWIVEITDEGKEEASRIFQDWIVEFQIFKMNEEF